MTVVEGPDSAPESADSLNLNTAKQSDTIPPLPPTKHDPYAALRYRDFRLLAVGRFASSLGEQMLTVAIGWELYERTHDTFALGLVGLVQIIPVLVLSIPAGQVADRYNRKRISMAMQAVMVFCSLALMLLSYTHGSLVLVYGFLTLIGAARALNGPANGALLPQTIPPEMFVSAATWSSSAWQFAAVLGPALGGFVIAWQNSALFVYLLNAIMGILFIGTVALIRGRQIALSKEPPTLQSLAAGIKFVWHTKIILATITLDLFAVLLGGATALLPAYAKDILNVGAQGLGWLQAAPSIGALLMGLTIAHRRPFEHAGRSLLLAVAGFGVATIIFGLSTSFILSLLMLMTLGALDNISVVIRSTLLLVRTPDEMRGRINAVNSIFVGSSNELGRFESGAVASLFGTVPAVVSGGIGTILVVILVGLIWPEIRQLRHLIES